MIWVSRLLRNRSDAPETGLAPAAGAAGKLRWMLASGNPAATGSKSVLLRLRCFLRAWLLLERYFSPTRDHRVGMRSKVVGNFFLAYSWLLQEPGQAQETVRLAQVGELKSKCRKKFPNGRPGRLPSTSERIAWERARARIGRRGLRAPPLSRD
jgi:hypothetical protein